MRIADVSRVVDRGRTTLGARANRVEWAAHRRLLAVGDSVRCPACGWSGQAFGASRKPRRWNRICPVCHSSERYRAFLSWLREERPNAGGRLLEIAPIHLIRPVATELGYDFCSLDLQSPRARVLGDLCRLPFADRSVDVVVCFHVLEHIPDDASAASELGRVLTDDGVAVVNVPYDPARTVTFEDPDTPPEDRERLYGQSDHVRMYGLDVTERLEAAGLAVTEAPWSDLFTPQRYRQLALDGDDDRFWFCRRRD